MTAALAALLLALSFIYSGLDAAWQALDRVRLRHRADKGDRRAKQMMSWEAVRPQADLVLAWTSHACAAGALVVLAAAISLQAGGAFAWLAPVIFAPLYAVFVQVVARQIFRRLPFVVLSRLWPLVTWAGLLWAPLARPTARLLRKIQAEPLPRRTASEELMALAEKTDGVSPLELSMLRSVLEFRGLTAADLALTVGDFPHAAADRALRELLSDRKSAEARHLLVIGADGLPLGAMSCGTAALSGAMSARAQSFARPLQSFADDLPAWKVLARLRRSQTPVAEVRDEKTGRFIGILTEQSVVARLLGQVV